jgi:hypothetical protein
MGRAALIFLRRPTLPVRHFGESTHNLDTSRETLKCTLWEYGNGMD